VDVRSGIIYLSGTSAKEERFAVKGDYRNSF